MLEKVIFKLMKTKERGKFLEAVESKYGTDAYVDFLREFSGNQKSNTKLMKEFRKWMRNKKRY